MSGMTTAIGLMSGTSMDGIDIALVRTDGEGRVERGPCLGITYPPEFRKALSQALEIAKGIEKRDERPENLGEIERDLTLRHAVGVRTFLDRFKLTSQDIDLIGFHGQTVLHRPLQGLTVQIGDGALLARQTGIPVVYDMRANDMVHGGQGAPLVPAYHAALAAGLSDFAGRPILFVNIGGISNLTFIGSGGDIIAYDSGPGNTLLDQWVEAGAGIPFDQGGSIASEGCVVASLAERYLAHPFFTSQQRLSLDRNDFLPPVQDEVGLHDGARTLAHVTAAAIVKSIRHLPERPDLIIVCGGGRLNKVIMSDLAVLAAPARVAPAEDFALNGDSMEAEAWAYLAVRSAKGLPLTYPGTTGVRLPVTGGVLAGPVIVQSERLQLLPWAKGDAVLVRDLHSTVETSRFVGEGLPWTLPYAELRIEGWMADFQRLGMSKLKLVRTSDGKFLGRAGFSVFGDDPVFELGYSIVRDEWGKGYATEIARSLIDWFFANRPERKILAFAYADNHASIRVLQRVGMIEVAPRKLHGKMCRFFEMASEG
jgi:1,6-anhydro-N-acetylmuramate kinase/RimJ/RimL family protein N-acetyltransferase